MARKGGVPQDRVLNCLELPAFTQYPPERNAPRAFFPPSRRDRPKPPLQDAPLPFILPFVRTMAAAAATAVASTRLITSGEDDRGPFPIVIFALYKRGFRICVNLPGPNRSGRSCGPPRLSEPLKKKGVQQNGQRPMAAAPSGAMTTSLREKSNRSPPCRNGNRKTASRDRRPKLAPKEPKCQKLPARD